MVRKIILLQILMLIYFPFVLFSKYSITGFWSDIIFSCILIFISIILSFKFKHENKILIRLNKGISIFYSVTFCLVVGIKIINPFNWTIFSTSQIEYKIKNSEITISYFEPTGAWGCGHGKYWETKTFLYFPIIEKEVYVDNCSLEDWSYFIKFGRWE